MQDNIQNAIQQALDESPERKFVESVEIAFTLKDVDLKNPANRIQEEVRLPTGRGKPVRITMFASGEMATKAKAAGIDVIDPSTIEDLGGNRQQARKMANKSDFFLSEIPHMGTVGRFLGVVLGPRGDAVVRQGLGHGRDPADRAGGRDPVRGRQSGPADLYRDAVERRHQAGLQVSRQRHRTRDPDQFVQGRQRRPGIQRTDVR